MMLANMKWFVILISVSIICNFILVPSQAQEECLVKAWDAYNNARYDEAIKNADECISTFEKQAETIQNKVMKPPPTGPVDKQTKDEIFQLGLLNDIATAYWIKGKSAQKIYEKDRTNSSYRSMAVESYQGACRFKHGRTWDPKGWFWSPCESAEKLMENMP